MTNPSRIAVVGGGPGGLLLARLLQSRGRSVTVLERDAHADERPQGGSLDLHADTGQRALRSAGLEAAFLAAARPEDQGDRLYDQHGTLLFDRDGAGDNRPEIDRSVLRRLLLDALEPETVTWGCRIEDVTPEPSGGFAITVDGRPERFDVVVGADGARSAVRPLLSSAAPCYEGVTLVEFGYAVASHPHVDRLAGRGKMFAVGDDRVLIAQRNGLGHIRGYAGLRLPEDVGRAWTRCTPGRVCSLLREAFAGWAPALLRMIEERAFLAVRPLDALPVDHAWPSRPGLTLLGDAAHLMSPFSGEGVNLALADAADLADALVSGEGWGAVAAHETRMAQRAGQAARGARAGLETALSRAGAGPVLAHYRERAAA